MEQLLLQSTIYQLVIAGILTVSLIIQLFYYLGIYSRVAFWKRKQVNNGELPPVSIVICAKNEEDNIKEFLPNVLQQDYPEFEVVVVNDCSSDNSDILLNNLVKQYPNLKVTTIREDEKFTHSKKLALTVGIKAAKYNHLLLTDADCTPQSSKWLLNMAQNFSANTSIVIGYGGYFARKGFVNKLIRIDTLFIALNYLGFALAKKTYMGIGRNLAYTKTLFFENKGFASHTNIDSGDDDLFIQEIATKSNTRVELIPESQTRSVPRKTYTTWIRQKRRHLSTSGNYRHGIKWMLSLEPFSRILFYASAIVLLALNYFPITIGAIVVFRLLIQLIIVKLSMNKLGEKKILLLTLFWDLFSPYFYARLLLVNKFSSNKPRWR